jgi:hypothetical protein
MSTQPPTSPEKCIAELKIRVPESMRDQIMRLSFVEDRSPSEYIRHVLALHLYGHARTVGPEAAEGEGNNGSAEGTRNSRGVRR